MVSSYTEVVVTEERNCTMSVTEICN